MEMQILEIAERIRGLRQIMDISEQEMAQITGVNVEDYRDYENGKNDFPFTFLLKSAERFGIDIVELMTGVDPKLSFYTVVRRGGGLPIERRKGFQYRHLAHLMKNKIAEPFLVTAPYSEEEQNKPTTYSAHQGQEFDYILKGSLKVDFDGHVEILQAGDAVYYDSGHRHGMIAAGGADCEFLAVVLKKQEEKTGKGDK
ncbi:MAG TPA: cupin domain-containing protein [Clostridia bacterium]|nr:cupin domain-containing protein [Clostridia bacterium]